MKERWSRQSAVMRQQKYLWLASFPKSGNTWFRSFLSALIQGKVEINKLASDGILSGRHLINQIHDLDTGLLFDNEVKNCYARAYAYNASIVPHLQIIKVHDAYHNDDHGIPIVDIESTYKAVYLVRNPLDVVASYANHNNCTIDHAIKMMCDKEGVLGSKIRGLGSKLQVPQLMYDWSGHVSSWLDQDKVELVVVRYEDMKKGEAEFIKIAKAIGFECSDEEVIEAVELTKFEKLKKQEEEKGFKEKMVETKSFFRSGKSGGWKSELTPEQAWIIVDAHKKVMDRLGYLEPALEHLNNLK